MAVISQAMTETAKTNRIVAEIEKRHAGLRFGNAGPAAVPEIAAPGPVSEEELSIQWEGPLEPLLKSLALRMDAELRVLGESPVQPVFVSVSYSGRSHAEALRKIDTSVFGFAEVGLSEDEAAIELRYAP